MATRKTGTVTGASLEKSTKARKGGLTGSKRVTGETTPAPSESTSQPSEQSITSLGTPTPPSIGEKLKGAAETVANLAEKGSNTASAIQGYASRITESIKGTDNDRNPYGITNGQVNTVDILQHASAEIDENVPQMDSAEATKRNIIIARQRNHVGVLLNNTKLKQDIATLDIEQQRLIGLLIDGKTTGINNEKKAVQFHRAVVGRDTEISKLEEDRELLTQQQVKTEGTQSRTALLAEQEQLKTAKLKEEIEKLGHEVQAVTYEKEKLKAETEAKFLAGF